VYRLLGWRHDADDVVQDVFLAALKQIHRFRAESSIGTWLAAIAIKKCRTWRKRRWVRWRWLGRQRLSEPASSPADEALVKDELAAEVRRAVQELAAPHREVIVLYYLEQMSVKEMAQLLQASPNAIDVRLHRARQRLRTKLGGLIEE
jgi:RNA polymerase sigma factor (sigma-70 family)